MSSEQQHEPAQQSTSEPGGSEDVTRGAAAMPQPAGAPASALAAVWARIKEHKVVQWTLAYVAFAYTALHAMQMAREAFEWPLEVSRITLLILLLCAPIAATLAWFHGHRARHRISATELSILTILLVIAGSLLWLYAPARHGGPGAASAAPFAPPAHSIAVLPFVNMSGDPQQEYFSDGLSEELLDALSRINELQVAARTSSFAFKGEHSDIATIGRRLNVAAVLEGSVRRSSGTVRISAQLINSVSGFHLWSQTYDRSLGDVLALQTEIADAVTGALRIRLLGGSAARIELGSSRDPAAFDAYLRGLKLARVATNPEEAHAPVEAYTEAIRLDPNYALAFAARSLDLWNWASHYTPDWLQHHDVLSRARADAERAIELAPELGEGHVALAQVLEAGLFEFGRANEECTRALALAPGNAQVLYWCSRLAADLGQTDTALSAARRGVALDPLNPLSHRALGDVLRTARRYQEAVTAYQDAIAVDPEHAVEAYARRGVSYYLLGDLQMARSSCEARPDYWESWVCQAMTYHRLGRHEEAAAALARVVQSGGDGAAYQYAQIHTQWGEQDAALTWLETALRLRDPGLIYLKLDPLLDLLRKQPRFLAVEQALKFPT
jgi:TolB-like protein